MDGQVQTAIFAAMGTTMKLVPLVRRAMDTATAWMAYLEAESVCVMKVGLVRLVMYAIRVSLDQNVLFAQLALTENNVSMACLEVRSAHAQKVDLAVIALLCVQVVNQKRVSAAGTAVAMMEGMVAVCARVLL
mmetsp:Transcript_23155/g.58710  ORF Transcript_23155/g.58710 Transcript_23155/m.58710 type:complete len:133 (-) Transcript_23155:465-863(-)